MRFDAVTLMKCMSFDKRAMLDVAEFVDAYDIPQHVVGFELKGDFVTFEFYVADTIRVESITLPLVVQLSERAQMMLEVL